MSGKHTALLVVMGIVVISVIAYSLSKKTDTGSAPPQQSTTQNQDTQAGKPKSVSLNLSPQNNSGENGTATLTENNGQTTVTLNISNEPANATQPSHIHFGSCAQLGGIEYALNPVVSGKSETIITQPLDQILKTQPAAINVHKSDSEINIYFACGDIPAY